MFQIRLTVFALLIFSSLNSFAQYSVGVKKNDDPTSDHKYRITGNAAGIPVIGVDRFTKVSGKLLLDNQPFPIPLRNQKLNLLQKGKLIKFTQSDGTGEFKFEGVLSNGDYQLVLESDKYQGEITVTINNYSAQDIVFLAKETAR